MIIRTGVLLSLSFLYFLNVFSRMQFSLLTPQAYFESSKGTILLFLAIGFGISLFLSQYAAAKFGVTKVVRVSSAFTGLWLILFPWSSTYIPPYLLLFSYGILTGFFLPAAITYLNYLFPSSKQAKAISFFSSFQTLAMIVTPLLASPKTILPMGCAFIFLTITLKSLDKIYWVHSSCMNSECDHSSPSFEDRSSPILGQYGSSRDFQNLGHSETLQNSHNLSRPSITEPKESPPTLEFFQSLMQSKLFWTLCLFQCLAVGLNVGVYISLPTCFITENCLESDRILSFLTLSRILGVASPLLFSFFLDLTDLKTTLTATSLLSGLFTIFLGIVPNQTLPYLLCCQGPFAIAMTTMIYIAVSQYSPPSRRAAVIALFASLSFIAGTGLLPQLLDLLGSKKLLPYGFIFLGMITCISAIRFFYSSILNSVLIERNIP